MPNPNPNPPQHLPSPLLSPHITEPTCSLDLNSITSVTKIITIWTTIHLRNSSFPNLEASFQLEDDSHSTEFAGSGGLPSKSSQGMPKAQTLVEIRNGEPSVKNVTDAARTVDVNSTTMATPWSFELKTLQPQATTTTGAVLLAILISYLLYWLSRSSSRQKHNPMPKLNLHSKKEETQATTKRKTMGSGRVAEIKRHRSAQLAREGKESEADKMATANEGEAKDARLGGDVLMTAVGGVGVGEDLAVGREGEKKESRKKEKKAGKWVKEVSFEKSW